MQNQTTPLSANKENYNSTQPLSGAFNANAIMGRNAAFRLPEAPVESLDALDEAGEDLEEQGMGEEVVAVESAGEVAGEGLFGGLAAGAAVGLDVAAVGGLAAIGVAGSNTNKDSEDTGNTIPQSTPIQIAKGDSAGVNIGPSEDGSVLASAGKTDVGLLGSKTPTASVNGLSVLNPNAPLPSGNPVTVDAENQTVGLNLGPLATTEIDLAVDELPTTLTNFLLKALSGDIAIDELLALNIPTSLAGTDLPITSTLNDVLGQVDTALRPVLDQVEPFLSTEGPIAQLQGALGGAPVVGDVVSQLTGVIEGGLPTGPLPIPADSIPAFPETGTIADLVLSAVPAAGASLAAGEVPSSGTLTAALNGLLPAGDSGSASELPGLPMTGTPLDMLTGLLPAGGESGGIPATGTPLDMVTGLLPTGGDAGLPSLPSAPETGTPLDMVTAQISSGISSVTAGGLPSASALPVPLPV